MFWCPSLLASRCRLTFIGKRAVEHLRGRHNVELGVNQSSACTQAQIGFPQTQLSLWPASLWLHQRQQPKQTSKQNSQHRTSPLQTPMNCQLSEGPHAVDSTMTQISCAERERQLCSTINRIVWSVVTVHFIFTCAMSWTATQSHSLRCSDSASKYRCGQCEPPRTSNYLKWTKQTGRSLSQQIKINRVRMVTHCALRGEFLSSFHPPSLL